MTTHKLIRTAFTAVIVLEELELHSCQHETTPSESTFDMYGGMTGMIAYVTRPSIPKGDDFLRIV